MINSNNPPSAFDYQNYREFLKDFFEFQKNRNHNFSHRYLAKKAGFASSSFFSHIVSGKRNLSIESVQKLAQALEIKNKEAEYFEYLVFFNQARTAEEKEDFLKKMERVRKTSSYYKLHHKQYAYFDEWYMPVLRELVCMVPWLGDYKVLAQCFDPAISVDKVRKAIEFMVEAGILLQEGENYKQSTDIISTAGMPAAIYQKTRKEYIFKAIQATEVLDKKLCSISSVTASMSEVGYKKMCRLVDEMRRTILEEAVHDESPEAVYQFNFQLYPLTRKMKG
jgi:uncharacterized protein (TIGR02147 family)